MVYKIAIGLVVASLSVSYASADENTSESGEVAGNTGVGRPSEIVILTTGGTIAGGLGEVEGTEYRSGILGGEALLEPLANEIDAVRIEIEEVANIPSQDMSDDVWLELAEKISIRHRRSGSPGFVVTHGTDTLEETAFFLDQIFDSGAVIVLTGAVRPAGASGADGKKNLMDAIATASSPAAAHRGVLVVFNGEIHSATYVRKVHLQNTSAYSSGDRGLVGTIVKGVPRFFDEAPYQKGSTSSLSRQLSLPKVGIAYMHAGVHPEILKPFKKQKYAGLVVAGVGSGNASEAMLRELRKMVDTGQIVVRASRVPYGSVLRNVEINDDESGFIVSGNLSPQKSRILLQALIACGIRDQVAIQRAFYEGRVGDCPNSVKNGVLVR